MSSIAPSCWRRAPEIAAADVELTQSDGTRQPLEATSAGGVASLVGRRMDDVERDLIIHTLGHTLGNRTHAATIQMTHAPISSDYRSTEAFASDCVDARRPRSAPA